MVGAYFGKPAQDAIYHKELFTGVANGWMGYEQVVGSRLGKLGIIINFVLRFLSFSA
jgi:hypothetical protein